MCRNKTYMCLCLALSLVFFMSTIVQFWITDYELHCLKAEKSEIIIAVIFICVTSPTFGAITSAYIGNYLGGFQSKKSLPICLVCCFFGLITGMPIPFFNSFYFVNFLLWVQFFFGGCMVPIMTSVMISSVEPR